MALPWFRLYSEFATDPKVQRLTEENQRRFIMVLCIRCSNDNVTLQDEDVAFQLRIGNDEWLETKAILMEKNLITEDNSPVNWDKRQRQSDTSNERVKRHRELKKTEMVSRNWSVTLPKQDSNALEEESEVERESNRESDSESPLSPPSGGHAPSTAKNPAASRFVPPVLDEVITYFMEINCSDLAEGYFDYHTSKGWKVGNSAMKDWRAAARTWKSNQKRFASNGNGKHSATYEKVAGVEFSLDDAVAQNRKWRLENEARQNRA